MIVLCSDIHIGEKSFNKSVLKLQLDFFEQQFFPFLKKHKVKHVIHTGDLVHNRSLIDLFILDKIKKRFFKWFDDNGVKFHTIVGNHDIYYKTKMEPNFFSENVKEFKNIIAYTKPKTIKIEKYKIGIVPWIIDDDEVKWPKNVDLLMGHFDIKSFPMQRGINSINGFEKKFFENYNMVLTGHYHIKSTKGNITYLGSPFQLNWGDHDIKKGFWSLKDNFEMKFIENIINPKFLKFFYTENDSKITIKVGGLKKGKLVTVTRDEAVHLAEDNYIKFITEKISNQQLFDLFYGVLSKLSKDDYKIEIIDISEMIGFDYKLVGDEFEEKSIINAIIQYVTAMSFEDTIEKQDLIDIFSHLHQKAAERILDIKTGISDLE